MKSQQIPYKPLRRSLRFWSYHLGCSPSTLSRWLARTGIDVKRRKHNPGVELREVLAAARMGGWTYWSY